MDFSIPIEHAPDTAISLVLIAAVDGTMGIGRNGSIPWDLPEDRRFFRNQTIGHPTLMGKRTYESIGGPLPERPCAVWTHSVPERIPDTPCIFSDDLDYMLDWCKQFQRKIYIIGGQSVYQALMDRATDIILSRIPGNYGCDCFFPPLHAHRCILRHPMEGFVIEHWQPCRPR